MTAEALGANLVQQSGCVVVWSCSFLDVYSPCSNCQDARRMARLERSMGMRFVDDEEAGLEGGSRDKSTMRWVLNHLRRGALRSGWAVLGT